MPLRGLKLIGLPTVLLSLVIPIHSSADDSLDIAGLLSVCQSCHVNDDGQLASWPDLAGLNEATIVAKLTAHRAQLVEDGTMSRVTQLLSDQDITQIAHYFASLTGKSKK